ncbi:MAG TPA: hypothetical protein VFB12_18685 [Ktedonobacteraceae bacterium]|nr:hypothetical protein [Ktedonobacteraceae bacterium]
MKEFARTRSIFILTGVALAAAAGGVTTLVRYVQSEIERRGYPSWEDCKCDLKYQKAIFQVWHSRHDRQGETIVLHEWGIYLYKSPLWLRRLLHHSAQVTATLNPWGRYVKCVALQPQEALQFAAMLHANPSNNEEHTEEHAPENSYVVWRREVLHFPHYLFDACTRRLYPVHISQQRLAQTEPLPALWDPRSNLPLPTEGAVLEASPNTRIDCIGWSPTQVSYCTARLKNA